VATVDRAKRELRFARVALEELGAAPIAEVAERLADAVPAIGQASFALVDSPRWPRDLDWTRGAFRRDPAPAARKVDAVMRAVYRALVAEGGGSDGAHPRSHPPRPLSMFPTPPLEYFERCGRDPRCKPHLAAISRELFGALVDRASGSAVSPVSGGAIFTRFMLAGFATYRALERLGVAAFESYPYLQFRLCAPSKKLPPKRMRTAALDVRRHLLAQIAAELGLCMANWELTLDQADAAILALAAARAARRGVLAATGNPAEGRFIFALDTVQARKLGLGRA